MFDRLGQEVRQGVPGAGETSARDLSSGFVIVPAQPRAKPSL